MNPRFLQYARLGGYALLVACAIHGTRNGWTRAYAVGIILSSIVAVGPEVSR